MKYIVLDDIDFDDNFNNIINNKIFNVIKLMELTCDE